MLTGGGFRKNKVRKTANGFLRRCWNATPHLLHPRILALAEDYRNGNCYLVLEFAQRHAVLFQESN